MDIGISKMTGKLKGLLAISTDTTSNKYCLAMQKDKDTICHHCYSQTMLTSFRKNCVPAFRRNSQVLSSSLLEGDVLPKVKQKVFRLAAHGELVNNIMFLNFCTFAAKNQNTLFTLWTKRKEIVLANYSEIPYNMLLIYSNPYLDQPMSSPPDGFDKVFNVVTVDSKDVNCGNKVCVECMTCYSRNNVAVVNELIKLKRRK